MSLYVICYELITLQEIQIYENSNCIALKCIFLLCTRSELDILLLHVLDWTNIWCLTVSLVRQLTVIVYKV